LVQKRLERALKDLGGKATRRSPGRPRGSKSASSASTATVAPRKRRKRRGGNRADQAVKLIEKSPGISASEIAKTMKIKPNYLYRVLGDLEKEGRVKKQGRQYFPGS
jgi:ribosomal protein S25